MKSATGNTNNYQLILFITTEKRQSIKRISYKTYWKALHELTFWESRAKDPNYSIIDMTYKIMDKTTNEILNRGKIK